MTVRLLTILILSVLIINSRWPAVAESTCGPIEICPVEDDCKPSKDCKISARPDCKPTSSFFGTQKDSDCNTDVGSEASLAIARCETEQAAQVATCRALQADKKAACRVQQTRQLSQCESSSTELKVPDLCENVNSLLASSAKRFNDVKGQAEDDSSGDKSWRATKKITGMTRCEIDTLKSGLTYYRCTVADSPDGTKVISMMFGLSKAISNCLKSPGVTPFEISESAVNSFWLDFSHLHARKLDSWLLYLYVDAM
jgi:hypothetical protein